jgi:enamine deaminase RidA (YjgF/YER057c/UK114 family)
MVFLGAAPANTRHEQGKIEASLPRRNTVTTGLHTRIHGGLRRTRRSAKTATTAAAAAASRRFTMAGTIERRLAQLGVTLPTPASPIANYVPFVRTGNTLIISGQLCFGADGKLVAKGQLGGSVSIEDGQKAAHACVINLLAQLKVALGDLDKVVRVIRLGGFINSAPGFNDGPKVMNGASDLMVEVFGDKGRHARTTVGVSALPLEAAIEVEGLFEVN